MTVKQLRIAQVADISDPYRWGTSHVSFAITSDCRHIAVMPSYGFRPDDDRYDRVYIYDFNGKLANALHSPRGTERGILFWPDDFHLLIPGYDLREGSITVLWRSLLDDRVNRPFRDTVLDGTQQSLVGAAVDGRFIAGRFSGANNQGAWLYDTGTRAVRRISIEEVTRAVFSPDQRHVAMIYDDHVSSGSYLCCLFSTSSGELLFSISDNGGTPSHVLAHLQVFIGFTHNSKYAIFGGSPGISLRELPHGDVVETFSGFSAIATAGTVSHDGQLCAIGTINGDIHVFSMANFRPLAHHESGSSPSYEHAVRHIAIAKDNRRLAATNINSVKTFSLSIT